MNPQKQAARPTWSMALREFSSTLDAEFDKLQAELPKAYEEFGRAAYPKYGVESVESQPTLRYERDQIETRLKRQRHIRSLQQLIRMELPYEATT